MKTIHTLPDAVLSQHVAILGKTGSGKSTVMRGMLEGLLDQGKPVALIDQEVRNTGRKFTARALAPKRFRIWRMK